MTINTRRARLIAGLMVAAMGIVPGGAMAQDERDGRGRPFSTRAADAPERLAEPRGRPFSEQRRVPAQPVERQERSRRDWNGSDDRGSGRDWNERRERDANIERGEWSRQGRDDRNGRDWQNGRDRESRQEWRHDREWRQDQRRDIARDHAHDRFDARQRWSNQRRWDNGWRSDARYDWQRYRTYNLNVYRLPRYYAPYGWNYGYRNLSIGVYLNSVLFARDYWIDDPYRYRLPPAYGHMRWVRYYDDALLIDTRDGYVVDVIRNFFW